MNIKKFEINPGVEATNIVASTPGGFDRTFIVLENITGWDDMPEEVRNSADRVTGDGEFVSKYTRTRGRTMEVTLRVINPKGGSVRELRNKIQNIKASREFSSIEITRDGITKNEREVVRDCYISGPILWDQKPGSARVSIVFKTGNATKELFTGGVNHSADIIY